MHFAERKDVATSTRRHTIGLIPISHTLTRSIPSASDADSAVSSPGKGRFGRRFIQADYRLSLHPSRTPLGSSCSPSRRDNDWRCFGRAGARMLT